jgi:predicted ATPase
MSETNWYVVTGAPSSGKTALVRELEKLGYRVVHEVARAYIETQMGQGRTLEDIRADKRSFENWILHTKIAIEAELSKDQVIIFDRAIPDSIAYFEVAGLDAKEAIGKSPLNRYKKVFLLDRLPYEVNHTRTEDDQIAIRLDQSLEQSYKMLGYEIMRIKVMPIEERVKVIVDQIEEE